MRLKGHGLNLTGGISLSVVLTDGSSVQGIFLGILGSQGNNFGCSQTLSASNGFSPLIGSLSPFINVSGADEFLVLQLTCSFGSFLPGNLVAINARNIAAIGPTSGTCIV